MACCGQKKVYTQNSPLILGQDEGASVEVIASVTVMGLKPNQKTWVRGSHLDAMIEAGWLRYV